MVSQEGELVALADRIVGELLEKVGRKAEFVDSWSRDQWIWLNSW